MSNASCTCHQTQELPKTIAWQLGVHYLLEGNVRHVGQRIRVSAQLIDAVSSQVLWGRRYDRELGDDFVVQDELVRNIVRAIRLKLAQQPALHPKMDYRGAPNWGVTP